MTNNTIPFIVMVKALEKIINFDDRFLQNIDLVDKNSFLDIRSKIVKAFDIGDAEPFSGDFDDEEFEYGDISDAVIGVTLNEYPQDTPQTKPIDVEERRAWCLKILEAVDSVATPSF